jgi:hypothetical protein
VRTTLLFIAASGLMFAQDFLRLVRHPEEAPKGGGTAQAQIVTLPPDVTSLVNGLAVCWVPLISNTGAAPTLSVNGLTAPITKHGTEPLIPYDLFAGHRACAVYESPTFQLQDLAAFFIRAPKAVNSNKGKQ